MRGRRWLEGGPALSNRAVSRQAIAGLSPLLPRMAGHILAQHIVHKRLPAIARGLEIGQHLGAVAHRNHCFLFSDIGRPRKLLSGTMAFNCVGVSGCASGSLRAAAVMALSSFALGMRTVGRLEIVDIDFNPARVAPAQGRLLIASLCQRPASAQALPHPVSAWWVLSRWPACCLWADPVWP